MRQSRYLLVANLPESISEEKIIKHFKRFGKVQSVKLLPPGSSNNHSDSSSSPGLCAAVAFTDIRSAAKAFEEERQQIEDRVIRTEYYEPAAASSSSSAAIYIHDTRDDALRGSNCNNSSRNERERGNGGPALPHSSSSSTSSSSSSSREYDNNSSSRVHSSSSRFVDPHPSSSSSRRTGGYSRSSPPPSNNSSSATNTSSSSGHIHCSRSNPSSSSTVRTTSGDRKRPISDGTSVGTNNSNSSRRSCEYGTSEGGGHYYHSSSSSHHHHNRGKSFSPSKMISENSDSPLRGEVDLSPSRVNMDSPSLYSRRRSSNVRSNNTSDLDPRRSLVRSTSSPGRYHEREGDGEERGRERSSRHFSPPSLHHRDSSSSVMRSSGTNNSYRGTTAPRSPGSSRSSSVISNSSRAEGMEKDALDLDKDSSSHLYSSSRRRSSDGVSLSVDSKENLRSYSSMDSQDSLLISRGDGHPSSGGNSSTSSALKRKYSEGDHITRDSSDVDSVHISERKRRLLECVKPVNMTPKDSLSSSSVVANVNTSATPSELSSRTDVRDRDSHSKGDHPSLHHRHHHHHHNQHSSSTHHSTSHTPFLSKSLSSVDSSDELQSDTRKLFQDPQLLLKILDEAINSHGGGSEGAKSSGSTDLIGSKTRKASLTDSNHSSSSSRRNRDPTSRSHLHKDPSTIPTIDAVSCVVNPSLVDPRRDWPAYSSVFPSSATSASLSSSLSTSTLLNSSSSEKSNNRVDPLDTETGLVSSTDSLPQDVHSTTNKSDDLLHGCEVSSSSDKTTSKPKKVLRLPLPEFAVFMFGASAAAIASKSHAVPGMTSLTVNPSLASPKNTSLTSPINTCSPCPIPPKRLRDASTDSKGSEVTTSDRDSTENLTFSKSLDSSCLSDHSDPSPSKGIEERIRVLDEKLITRPHLANVVTAASSSSSSSITAAIGLLSCNPSHRSSEPATPTIDYSKYNIKKKSQANQGGASGESQKNEQSDIVKNLLKSSIFDQDSKRLEHINEKYEPKDHASVTSETSTTSSNSAPSATTASSTPSGSMSNYRIPLRTKAAAKEFPSSNDTPSTSAVSRTSTSTSTTGLTGLASLSRKMSEPSKLPSNLKKDCPTTPQSAPARSFPSAYGPFASLADKKGSIDWKTAVKDPRREAGEFRDPRTHKSSLVSSALSASAGERASIQKSLSMPTGAKSTPSLMKSENRPFSSLLSSSSKDSKEHEAVHNKRKPSTEGMEGESDGTPSSKNEMGKLSSCNKNSSTYSGKVSSKEWSLSATTKGESQSSIKNKDKGDKESKGNEVGKEQTSLSSSRGTGEKVKSSKSLDNCTSKTGLKQQKQPIASSSGGKASTCLNKEKAKSLKDKIMDNKKSSSTSNNKDQAKESLQDKKSSRDSKTSKESKKAQDKKGKEKQQGKHAQEKKERKKLQELQRLGDSFKRQEDEPVYLSMYDKVKQRSANLQNLNKNILDHTHPPSSSSSTTKGGKTPATSDKNRKSSRVKDSDSSDSDDDSEESSESQSSSDADDRAVTLNKRRRKPVIESSSSSSSSEEDDEDEDDDDEDNDEEEDLRRKKKPSPARRSPVRGPKTTKANKSSVQSSNRSKRPAKSSSSSDSEEEVIKAKKKLKTKKKPKPSYSDSDSDEEEQDIVSRKPCTTSNKKPHKACKGGKGTALISSDEQSSPHESKSSSGKGGSMEKKKTKKASSLMSTSSSPLKEQGDLPSHPSGKKNKAELKSAEKQAAGDRREQHKDDIKVKGESRTDANTNNHHDRSHSHPTPTTPSKTSKDLLSESKVVSSSSVKGDLKKKKPSLSTAIRDKGEKTAKTSSTSPSLKDKEQENRKVMERKKGEASERVSDSSKTSKMISPSSETLKKVAKGEKDIKRKDGAGALSSVSPSKEKNSSSNLSSIHRSSNFKATSSESLSSKVTSDQDEKSDSDIDRREPFRRLEAFLSKSHLKSDSSDDDEATRKPAFSHKHPTPGVISHTEWERAECGKVISPSLKTSTSSSSSSSSPAKKDKGVRESGGHHSHEALDKKSSPALSRLSTDVDAKSKAFLSSSSGTLEKKTSSSKKGKRDEDKGKAPLDRIKGITTTATSHHIASRTLKSLPDPAKASPPLVSSTSDSLPSSHFFKSPEPESPIHAIRDDLSDSLEDYKLDQDLSEEARRSAEKAERYKNHESDSSGDDLIIPKSPLISPLGRNKKDTEERPVRSFDQEAAIEAKRLEVELNQTWKKSQVSSSPFGELICSTSALSGNSTRDSSSLPRSDANLNSLSIHIPGVESVVKMPDVHTSPLFHRHLPSDIGETGVPTLPLKEEGDANETTKDESSEVDNQRINEDDMAVSALLQEMDEKTSLEIPTIEVPEGGIEDPYNLLPDDEPHPLQISEEAVETEHQHQRGSRSSLHLSSPFDSKDSLHHRPETTSVRGGLEPDSISDVTSSSTARTTMSVLLVADELSCDRSIHPYIEPSKQQQEQMKERSERLSISSSSSHSSSGSSPSPALLSSPSKRLTVDPHHHLHLASDGIGVGEMHDLTNIPHTAPASLLHVSGVKEMAEVQSLRTQVGGEQENETKVKVYDDSRSSKTTMASDADTSKEDEAARETGEEANASDRPKRGRRPKTRKFSESGLVMPRYEGSGPAESVAPKEQQQTQSTAVSNRLTRRSALTTSNTCVEKIRRSPRVASLDPDGTSTTTSSLQTSGEEGSGDEKHQADDRRRSGRRKKTTSGDSAQKGADLSAQVENTLKTPTKEGRLLGRRQREGEKVSEQHRKSTHAYDVFEFTDEEDEAGPIPLHEAMHASKVPNAELLYQPKDDKKSSFHLDELHEEEKDRDGEVSSHGHKLSLTIRHDSVTGTAEVVKTSKALVSSEETTAGQTPLPVETSLSAASKVTAKSSAGLPPPPTLTSSALSAVTAAEQEMAEVKATRKSARLMSQNKSTVDEVIEDVIKGGENSPRLRRLQRVRRSEENNLPSVAASSAVAGDSNDDELSEDTENVSCKDSISGRETRHQRPYRITRSSTRGSIASEEATDASSSSASMFDETSSHSTTTTPTLIVAPAAAAQPGSRRHSHPTPVKEKTLDYQSSSVSKDDSTSYPSEAVISSDLQTVVSSSSLPPSSSVLVSTAAGLHSTSSSVAPEKKITEPSIEKKCEMPPSLPVSVVDMVTTQPLPSTTNTNVPSLPTPSVIQEPMRTLTPFIPSVSERIHNSTTAQKLKTGKAFLHLDQDLSKSSSSFSLQPSLHSISSGLPLPPSGTTDANNVPISSKGEVRVQPPPAHTKITIEPKQPSIQSTVMAASTGYASPAGAPSTVVEQKSSPVIVQGRITHTPDLIQRQQQSGSPGFPPHFSQGGGDGRSQGPLSQSQKEFLLQQEISLRQQQHQIHGRPTPPPAPSPSLSLPPNLPPELHQHYKQLGHIPPHLMSHPSDMPFNFSHVIFPPSYPMHPDLARLHGLGPHPRPYGVPLPFDTRAQAKEDERTKLQRQKEQIEEEYKRAREQEGSLLMPTGLASHLRPSLSSYPSAPGLVRQGIAPHLLSPHDRLTDSPAVMGHAFRHLPPHPSNDSKATHEIALHSPASKSGQQTPEPLTRVYGHPSIASPAPGYLDSRSLHQPAHSPVFRHNIPSPAGPRMEEDSRGKLPHHIAPPPSSGFHLPHLQQHPLSMEEGLLRRLPPMGSEAPGVPLIPPPPAHGMTQPHSHPQTPPYAQVPASGDSQILQRYPIVWRGLLALKNDQASVQIQFISGNQEVARTALPPMADGQAAPVRISQRMRLEQSQLEGVARKMQSLEEHAILLALPCGRDQMDVLQQSNNLRNGFIQYLQSKQAAGIVNFSTPGSQATTHVIHIFPSGDFANGHLVRIAPDLLHGISGISHMVIIITTV